MTPPLRVVLAAGGTGGHIAPALAVGEALESIEPGCELTFVCGSKPLELGMYRSAGREPVVLEGRPLMGRNPAQLARAAALAVRATWQAVRMLRAKRPHVVVGMGGYAATPVVLAASLLGIPTHIHEQNAVPGRANRLLARLATSASAAHRAALPGLRNRLTRLMGNPLRPSFFGASRADGIEAFGIIEDRPVLLVMGGSQGAEGLNSVVYEALQELAERLPESIRPQVLWAAGADHADHWREWVAADERLRHNVKVFPFIHDTAAAYACCDLAITRAGAGTLAELAASGTPSLLVPYPHARDDHQTQNARELCEAGGALLFPESELSGKLLAQYILRLLKAPRRLLRMSLAASAQGRPRAAWEMAQYLRGLTGPRAPERVAKACRPMAALPLHASASTRGAT